MPRTNTRTDATTPEAGDLVLPADVGDYVALLKPRVMSLVVFTALVGLMIAPVSLHPVVSVISLLAIAVGAGAAGALNMWYDADIDRLMSRTRDRPIPAGRVQPEEVLAFGMTLAVGSVIVLGLAANWFAALLLGFTISFYAVIYTMWLKRRTPQNIVIGGAAGAFPPVIAWAAATGGLAIEPLVLFAIIFFWTPPHFWALALVRSGDYSRAGVPMLPVTAGIDETRRQILIYSLVLAPLGLAPSMLGFGGWLYTAVAAGLGCWLLWLAFRLYRGPANAVGPVARKLFGFSILYLFVLFAALLAERFAGATPLPGVWS